MVFTHEFNIHSIGGEILSIRWISHSFRFDVAFITERVEVRNNNNTKKKETEKTNTLL